MLTATRPSPFTQARSFALQGAAWVLALFGAIRLGWFEAHAVLPLTLLQGRIARSGFGAPSAPIDVTLACSGADALALCAGAILAYPVPWRTRLAGAAGGIGLILALNIVRIGTLGRAAASPSLFTALHVYAWPALLTVAIAGYVFGWMRYADRGVPRKPGTSPNDTPDAPGTAIAVVHADPPRVVTRRFVLLTALFLGLFTAASPLYLDSAAVLAVATFVARASALCLGFFGVQASASANILFTSRGGFLVTQECVSTPLIPVYFAAVCAYPAAWRHRALALLAAAPLFVALGIARLLVVVLPDAIIGSPLFIIHAFYQLLLAAVVVCLAAVWRHGAGATAWRRALLGAALGIVLAYLVAPLDARALASAFAAGAPLEDPQGAIALLPTFQIGLYVALTFAVFAAVRWRPFLLGLAALALSQVAVVAALHALVRHAGITPHVRDIRGWALAGPLMVIAALVTYDRPRR